MKHYKGILTIAAAAVFSAPVDATSFSVEARSLGMGNARVATADIGTAPFANPGMLAYQRRREDFSMLIGVGAYLMDQDDVIGKIDEYQAAYSSFEADPVGNINDGLQALSIAQSLDGNIISPKASALFSTGFAAEHWGFAVSARADAIAAGTVTNISQNVGELLDPTKNILEVEGVLTSELGASVARNFALMGRKIAVGVKPKYVKVDNIYIRESISTVDTGLGDLIDDSKKDLGDFTTVDVGLVMGLTENTQIGLVATNLLSHKIDYINSAAVPVTLSFDTQARLGVAYRSDFLTLGADIDLIENDALFSSQTFEALKSQFVSVGGEFNLLHFMQLRLGAEKNIADGISDAAKDPLYTAGLGFWLGFNIDLAVVAQSGSLGGFLQTGFRF